MRETLCTVYMMTNIRRTVIYIGVTSDLRKRVWEHKTKQDPGCFTARYNATVLIWYEVTPSIKTAIAREKQIKGGSRAKKIALIENMNAEWRDLSADWE